MGTRELFPLQPEGSAASPGSGRPTRVRYQVLAAACSLALIAYIHRNGFATVGTDIREQLNLSQPQYGWLMFAFLFAYAAFEVPWGVLGDRWGARHILALMTLGWSVLTAAVVLVLWLPILPWVAYSLQQFYFLLLLRFLFGFFQAGAFPALSRVMTDWMPMQERATAQGLIWMFSRAGGALAPFLFVELIGAFGGKWQTPWALGAGLGVIWCALFWPWFRNRPEEMPRVNAAERQLIVAGRAHPAGHGQVPWSKLLGSLSVWALCLMYGCGGFSATFFITWLPDYLRKTRGLTQGEMKWLSGLPLACGVLACAGGGFFSDWFIRRTGNRKWGRRINGMIGHVCAGLALLATSWVDDVWLLGMLLCITFFFNDLAMGPAWACCADIGGRYAGTLGGTMNMVGNLGGALMAVVVGQLLGRDFALQMRQVVEQQPVVTEYVLAGNSVLFVIFACSFWLASLCWLGVDVTRPLEADHSAADSPILPAEPEP